MEKTHTYQFLRKIALVIAIAGAIVSFILVTRAGQNNKSIILRLLFMGWVLLPFVTLIATNVNKRWDFNERGLLYWITIAIAVVSPICYTGILNPPGVKLTPVFLFVPLLSWIVFTVFILVTRRTRV